MNIAHTLILASTLLSAAANADNFALTSPDISEGKTLTSQQVFSGFGCEGSNVVPRLHWTNAPTATKSYAVTMYDPDVPTGSGWWHWTQINIAAKTQSITPKTVKHSTPIINDFGQKGYGGACPPAGEMHRYITTVHALNTEQLDAPDNATSAYVRFLINAHSIDSASITSTYTR